MSKNIPLTVRPNKTNVDAWVKNPNDLPALPQAAMKKLSVEIHPDLHRRLRLHSATVGIPISELVREQIESLLKSTG